MASGSGLCLPSETLDRERSSQFTLGRSAVLIDVEGDYLFKVKRLKSDASDQEDESDSEEDLVKDPDYEPAMRCLLYTSPSPRDRQKSRMPSSA